MMFWKEWLEEEEAVLHKSGVTDELFRAQGRVEVLKRAIGMEEEVREYSHNKVLGKVGNLNQVPMKG